MQGVAYLGESMKQVTLAALAITALASCVSTTLQGYEGLARPDDETALVTVERPTNNRGDATIRIVSVDTPLGEPISVAARAVRLLPRETCLGVRAYSSSVASMTVELCFEPSPGRRYQVRASTTAPESPMAVFDVHGLFLIDRGSQEVVAHTPGIDDTILV